MNRIVLGIIVAVLGIVAMVTYSFKDKIISDPESDSKDWKYQIKEQWDLPEDLREVSGIVWLGDRQIGAVQDEEGIIFLYDLSSKKIEKKINFGGNGDYEGITRVRNVLWVLESNGKLFEINFQQNEADVKEYKIQLGHKVNFEGLCYDQLNRQLLLTAKEEKGFIEERNIYGFDLLNKSFKNEPVLKLNLEQPILEELDSDFKPSELQIDSNGNYWVLDGKHPGLLILNKSFIPQRIIELNEDKFAQPEGLTFDQRGHVYISSEEGKNPAVIYRIRLKKPVK